MMPNYQYQQMPQQMPVMNGLNYAPAQQMQMQQPNWNRPQTQPSYLSGRYINNFNDIQPGEVQMDGSRSYFPTSDESMIFVKFWNNEGRLDHRKYVLVPNDQDAVEQKPDILEMINSRFDKLEKIMTNNKNFKQNNQPNKKEGDC